MDTNGGMNSVPLKNEQAVEMGEYKEKSLFLNKI